MAQFGTGKNPPWARAGDMSAPGITVASLGQQQVGVGNPLLSQPGVATPTVYSLATTQPTIAQQQFTTQQVAVASMQNLQQLQQQQQAAQHSLQAPLQQPPAVLPQPGIAIPTTLATTQVATVSYPTPRAAQQAGPQPKQRVFTGTVTKLHDNFGFVDEDVFFQISCVKGQLPKVGDRVLVEATYNANMPFKWNATRIQVLPTQGAGSMSSGGPGNFNFNKPPPMNMHNQGFSQQPPPLMAQQTQPTAGRFKQYPQNNDYGLLPAPGGPGGRGAPQIQQNRGNDRQAFRERPERSGRDRERHRERERERPRTPPRKRSRSPRRSRSPSSRPRSPVRRRNQRIVPRYMVQVPKLSLDGIEANVILLRSRYTNLYVPSDFFNASSSWTDAFPLHRPFSLGMPCSFHIMHKEVAPLDRGDSICEPSDADHLYSAKVMLLASPSTEELYHKSCALSEDPPELREGFQHPTRLINFLVGMKGKSEPMAIGGPWSPSLDGPNPEEDPRVLIKTAIRNTRALTGIDLSGCTQWYRFVEIRYHRPEETHKGRLVPARVETVVIFLPDVWSCVPSRLEWDELQAAYKKQLLDKIAEETKEDQQGEEEDEAEGEAEEKTDPTHFTELDPKTMKVADLRRELECRTLSSKGLKSQLIARLTKAIKTEQEKEEEEAESKDNMAESTPKPEEDAKPELDEKEEEKKKKEEEERKRKEEKERQLRERRYIIPENPTILVHPSSTAKSGKFDCSVMSLSVLLDYRPEDNKEHSFEVSLFAELFNEMLMRDFGFRIYKCLVAAPEKKEEEKKRDKKSDKEEKKEKEKEEKKDKEKDKKEDEKDGPSSAKKRKTEEKEEKKDKDEKKDDKSKDDKRKEDRKESKKEKSESKKDEDDNEDKEDESEEDDADKKDKEKDRHHKHEKVKYQTLYRELLLSFVYFDQTHTGYLLDKDVEEIVHTLGLQLSRAQVRKLVQKLVSRDMLNYRKLTDVPIVKEEKKEVPVEDATAAVDEAMDCEESKDVKSTPAELKPVLDDESLAIGNKLLLPQRKQQDIRKRVKKEPGTETKESDNQMVTYKGAMIDLDSVMQRLERSEKLRGAVEEKLKETQDEMDALKSVFSSSEQTSQKVALELQDLKKKLRDQKKATENAESSNKKYTELITKSKQALSGMLIDFSKVLNAEEKSSSSSSTPVKEVNGEK